MTQNQLAYQQLLETQRANKVREEEAERTNRMNENIKKTGNVLNFIGKAADIIADFIPGGAAAKAGAKAGAKAASGMIDAFKRSRK